jgi:hypothetical protein
MIEKILIISLLVENEIRIKSFKNKEKKVKLLTLNDWDFNFLKESLKNN